MKKLFMVAMALTVACVANADTIVTQKINEVEWRFKLNPDAGTATLGLGKTDEASRACEYVSVDAADIPWKFTGTDGIEYTVTTVAYGAFFEHDKLYGILTIPYAVKTIEGYAFRKATSIEKLEGMRGVTHITGTTAFSNLENLEMEGTLDLSSIVSLATSAFYGDKKLTVPVKFGNSLTEFSENFFNQSYFSGTAVIPANVGNVGNSSGNNMFAYAHGLEAIWIKGKPTVASQTYTTVYCKTFAQQSSSIKVILMGKNTKGASMTNSGNNAMLNGDKNVQVFVPANGNWEGLVIGGVNNNKWEYGSDKDFDLDIDDGNMRVTFLPTTADKLVKCLEWATLFKEHFDLEPRISVTQTLDLSDVTITEAMTQNVTFDRLIFSAKTQSELTSILTSFPKSTPIAIDPTGLTETMTITNEYTNVFVKSAPGTKVQKTFKGTVIALQ